MDLLDVGADYILGLVRTANQVETVHLYSLSRNVRSSMSRAARRSDHLHCRRSSRQDGACRCAGIGQTGDGSVASFYMIATPPGTGTVETRTYLSTFAHDGRLQTTQPLPEDGFGGPLVVSRAGDAIYAVIDEPYPSVVRYRLPTRFAQSP
ncbi:MAG: hypothetical protein WEF86_14200 [Gemmatimonadota bacterium]